MRLRQIWEDNTGALSFMRVFLTPAILACIFGIIHGAIKGDPTTIGASVAGITGMLMTKAIQTKYELSLSRNEASHEQHLDRLKE